jgi:transcription initiation factor TFIID TATA-box-binding protein
LKLLEIQDTATSHMHDDIEIVNVVGSGDLKRELDLQALAADLDLPEAEYNADMNALLLRFTQNGPLTILYSSGKYIVRGGSERGNLDQANRQLLSTLSELGISYENPAFDVRNLVCVCDTGIEVNLNHLMVDIGLENVEFEPEQFPGLVFHPTDHDCVALIFSSGKIIITGLRYETEIEELYIKLRNKIINKFG